MAEIEEISRKLKGSAFLKIEVVDETALLIDTTTTTTTALISKPKPKISRRQETTKMKKRPRKDWKIKNSSCCAKKYSRPEMLALSLHNLDHQRKSWSHIYAALTASVAAEYDGLLTPPRRPLFIHNCDGGASAMGKRSPLKISVH